MKLFVAPDSFKGSISAEEFCEAAKSVFDELGTEYALYPMADGGEGTVKATTSALGGSYEKAWVTAPLGDKTTAEYGLLNGRTAVMEMSQASGIALTEGRKNPFAATTYGTGEMILDALNKGAREIIIGIGGSGTNDGGAGMLSALGAKFYSADGNILNPCPSELMHLAKADFSQLDRQLENIKITVACDVTNPLCGQNGASHVFGRQKGASERDRYELDKILTNMAKVVLKCTGTDHSQREGAGAAGGLGFGLMQLPNVIFRRGFEVVSSMLDIENKMREFSPDIVITGEGQLNFQSEMGKLPVEIAKLAKKNGFRCIVIAGALGDGYDKCTGYFDGVYQLMEEGMSVEYSIQNASYLLKKKLYNIMLTMC